MTIAINSSDFLNLTGNDLFYDYFINIAASKPEHRFIFITSPLPYAPPVNSKNIIHVISSPKANNPLMWKIWLDYTLAGIIRKYKADLVVNTGGACSLRTKTIQSMFISDLSYLYFPHFFSKRGLYFLKKNMFAFLNKAATIVTASDFLAKEIILKYQVDKKKIHTFQLRAGDLYKPAGYDEKESVKEKYAAGKEYFLFSGEIGPRYNLKNLLKAFSFFKKRQKSNMQLIITGKALSPNDPFIENLKTYKYRREVHLLLDLPENELATITAAAYAMLYPAVYNGTAIFSLRAMQCGVPVITGNTGAVTELPVLYADPGNFEDIADKMMLLFKDETYRAELINTGKLSVQKNNENKTDELIWEAILKPV